MMGPRYLFDRNKVAAPYQVLVCDLRQSARNVRMFEAEGAGLRMSHALSIEERSRFAPWPAGLSSAHHWSRSSLIMYLTLVSTTCSFTGRRIGEFMVLDGGVDMRLGGRQLAIMKVLWTAGEATVAQLQTRLDVDPPLAYSTVATVLSRMEQKGLVKHRSEDRVFYYQAAVSQNHAGQSLVGEFVSRVFDGSPSELVNHLLESDQVDGNELQRIKKLVQEHEARIKKQQRSKP